MVRTLWTALLVVPALVAARNTGGGGEVNLNGIVDLLLVGLEEELGRGSGELGRLPDLNKSWSRLKITVTLNCTGGRIASLGNITRDGDVVLKKEGSEVSLRAELTLNRLAVRYDKCVVKGAGLKSTDPLLLTAGSVSVVAKFSATRTQENCTNQLDYMVVTDIGELETEMGDGLVPWIKEALVNFFAKRNRNSTIAGINQKLESAATKALVKRKNLCTKIFFYVRN